MNYFIQNTNWFFFLSLFLFTSCEGDQRNIQSFYYPIELLKEGKIYEYQSIGNELDPPFYYFIKTLQQDSTTYLLTTSYGHDFTPYQFVREEWVSNGMLLESFLWYETDSTGKQVKIPVNIESGNVFGFDIKDPPSILRTSLNWKLSQDSLTTMTFIRDRQFEKDTIYTFDNEQYKAVKLHVLELIDNEREGHLEQQYVSKEIYAKGIGLVYFQKNIDANWQMKYELKAIYDMDTFVKQFKVNIGGQETANGGE